MIDNYYDTPSDEIFEEIKKEAIKIWETYDNTYKYVDEKVGRVNSITNFKDNALCIVSMFDSTNRSKLLLALSNNARTYILERIS